MNRVVSFLNLKKCAVFFLCFVLNFAKFTTLNGNKSLATAMTLLKSKLLSLAYKLNENKNDDKLVTYDDIKDLTPQQLDDFYTDYFNVPSKKFNPDVKILYDREKTNRKIIKVESLKQKSDLCGWYTAFNGTEMYKAALAEKFDNKDNLIVDLKRVSDDKNIELGSIYNSNVTPYENFDSKKPKQFDVWVKRRILDLQALSQNDIQMFYEGAFEKLTPLFTHKKSTISSAWLANDDICLLCIFSLNLFKQVQNQGGFIPDQSKLFDVKAGMVFPHLCRLEIKVFTMLEFFPYIFQKFAREFRLTGKPILFFVNLNDSHWISAVMTKKGLFFADSFNNDRTTIFEIYYDYFVGRDFKPCDSYKSDIELFKQYSEDFKILKNEKQVLTDLKNNFETSRFCKMLIDSQDSPLYKLSLNYTISNIENAKTIVAFFKDKIIKNETDPERINTLTNYAKNAEKNLEKHEKASSDELSTSSDLKNYFNVLLCNKESPLSLHCADQLKNSEDFAKESIKYLKNYVSEKKRIYLNSFLHCFEPTMKDLDAFRKKLISKQSSN